MSKSDPEHCLVITYGMGGMGEELRHQRRNQEILESVYSTLELKWKP